MFHSDIYQVVRLSITKGVLFMSRKSRVNWHEAAFCAFQIELKDYSDLLEYIEEYALGKNKYRIDLLVIKKLADKTIPKNIARIFKTFNLIEMKGVGSSVSTDSYYKTIGYAGLLIDQTGELNQYTSLNLSLTFLSFHYPRNLMNHLKKERKLTVEKISPGVYYINKETFNTQIIVAKELPSEDNLYLRCLADRLQDDKLANKLADECRKHKDQEIYIKYLHQLTTSNIKKEGELHMVCEGLLNLCGTSSAEIIERTKKEDAEYYQPKIDQLSSQITYLKSLLTQHNIPFEPDID